MHYIMLFCLVYHIYFLFKLIIQFFIFIFHNFLYPLQASNNDWQFFCYSLLWLKFGGNSEQLCSLGRIQCNLLAIVRNKMEFNNLMKPTLFPIGLKFVPNFTFAHHRLSNQIFAVLRPSFFTKVKFCKLQIKSRQKLIKKSNFFKTQKKNLFNCKL